MKIIVLSSSAVLSAVLFFLPVKPDGPAKSVALGSYECWANGSARMLLNFTITGPGRYTASDGSKGTFTFDPGSKAINFTGYERDVLPSGVHTIYHEPQGKPAVSFRNGSNSEISFCEKV